MVDGQTAGAQRCSSVVIGGAGALLPRPPAPREVVAVRETARPAYNEGPRGDRSGFLDWANGARHNALSPRRGPRMRRLAGRLMRMAEPTAIAILAIHPVARAALWLALILALTAGALWVVRRLRDVEVDDKQDASKLLTKFRDLHSGGGLSDDEYRTIKTKLATQLQADVGATGDPADDEGPRDERDDQSGDVRQGAD